MHLAQGRYRAASNSLEQALSFNFQVGKSPVFLLVKASVEKEEGKLEEALETFEEALRFAFVFARADMRKHVGSRAPKYDGLVVRKHLRATTATNTTHEAKKGRIRA